MSSTRVDRLAAEARTLGFDRLGVCGHLPSPRASDAYRRWLAAGMAGEMAYLSRPDRVARALDPCGSLPSARSMVVVGVDYSRADLAPEVRADPSRGLIAAYAHGGDYHDAILPRLTALAERAGDVLGRPVAHRALVDFAPVLERDAAMRAGLGFIGRNTMLIHPRRGAWSFLAELLVDVPLVPDSEGAADDSRAGVPDPCGRCRRCLDSCPTGAFAAPYVLDARRCISYLTIELKGPIPRALRPLLGNRIFGCDACNDVCPYNRRFARPTKEDGARPDADRIAPRLHDLVGLDKAAFRRRFGGTALARAGRRGLLRNVCVALGNWREPAAVPCLADALADDEALVRGHAAWALGRAGTTGAREALSRARKREPDPWVCSEIDSALAGAA